MDGNPPKANERKRHRNPRSFSHDKRVNTRWKEPNREITHGKNRKSIIDLLDSHIRFSRHGGGKELSNLV
jgi:hypothetical protein